MAMEVPVMDGITVHEIESERLRTRVLTCGPEEGIPVIFVHGNVSSATFWEETMLALPDGYRAIAPDNRGYGGADPDKKIDATRGLGDLSDDLAALMDTLSIEQAHFVGHSLGGSVLWRFMIDYPARMLSVTQVNPGSPYGFGGCKGLDGELCFEDAAGSGAGIVNPEFVQLIKDQDTGTENQSSPRNVMMNFYFKPGLQLSEERADALVKSMLSIHTGDDAYPGDAVASENWPGAAPGVKGPNNAISPKYKDDAEKLYAIEPKPPVIWIRGAEDQIVSDASFFELGTLGQLGAVPGWPGAEVFPPQPMVSQTRTVLDEYQRHDGAYAEVVIENTGHSPYIEKPDEFNGHFHAFIQQHSE